MKRGWRGKGIALLAAIVLSVAVIAGCGSSSSTTDGSTGEGQASKQFLGPKGENAQAKYGHEGSAEELAQASRIVAQSLQARSEHNWAAQCATLSVELQTEVVGKAAVGRPKKCGAKLGIEGKTAPQSILKDDLAGSVVVLRVKGDKGYALYHDTDKKDWAMPMEKEEDGEWKVGRLLAEELPR